MYSEFKSFLLKQNVLALAIGFIFGAAVGKVVSALVNDLIMPLVGMAMPGGDWRAYIFQVGNAKFLVGDFIGTLLDFVIIALTVFVVGKMLMKPEPTPETQVCPHCTEIIAKAATHCKYCTQPVRTAAGARV